MLLCASVFHVRFVFFILRSCFVSLPLHVVPSSLTVLFCCVTEPSMRDWVCILLHSMKMLHLIIFHCLASSSSLTRDMWSAQKKKNVHNKYQEYVKRNEKKNLIRFHKYSRYKREECKFIRFPCVWMGLCTYAVFISSNAHLTITRCNIMHTLDFLLASFLLIHYNAFGDAWNIAFWWTT